MYSTVAFASLRSFHHYIANHYDVIRHAAANFLPFSYIQ